MKLSNLTLAVFMCLGLTSTAHALSKDRGGGTFIACEDEKGLLSQLAFDDYGGRAIQQGRPDLAQFTDYKKALYYLLNEIEAAHKPAGQLLKQYADQLITNMSFEEDLAVIDDHSYYNDGGCRKYIQAAVQDFKSINLLINKKIWNHPEMNTFLKTSLMFHEVYYGYLNSIGAFGENLKAHHVRIWVNELLLNQSSGIAEDRKNKMLIMLNVLTDTSDVRDCAVAITLLDSNSPDSYKSIVKHRETITSAAKKTTDEVMKIIKYNGSVEHGPKDLNLHLINTYHFSANFEIEDTAVAFSFNKQYRRSFYYIDGQIPERGVKATCSQFVVNNEVTLNECASPPHYIEFYAPQTPERDWRMTGGIERLGFDSKDKVFKEGFVKQMPSGKKYIFTVTCGSVFN